MQAFWLPDTARPVLHFAPWQSGDAKGPLCNALGWQDLRWDRYDQALQRQVYLDARGRRVFTDVLQCAPEGLPLCRLCWRRWLWLDQALHFRQAEHG